EERNLLSGMDAFSKVLAYGKCDRDGPEGTAGQFHVQGRTMPVVMPHEPLERRVGPHRQHEDVGDRTCVERNLPELRRPPSFSGPLRLGQQPWPDRWRPVRRYELRRRDCFAPSNLLGWEDLCGWHRGLGADGHERLGP